MSEPTIDAVDFYWRPGCGFCMNLDRDLERAGIPLSKHNIWEDPADAAVVRQHANGNETVPTVVIGDIAMVNPRAVDVITVLAAKAPHSPEGWEPFQLGGWAKLPEAARRLTISERLA